MSQFTIFKDSISKLSTEFFCYTTQPLSMWATLYRNQTVTTKAAILYFHGGGLLYGERDDLPKYHVNQLTQAGYAILTFDYRLAPTTKLPSILSDIDNAITWYQDNREDLFHFSCPYFLWGRSAGAYLCLLAGLHPFKEKPLGILSYYGYGCLQSPWFDTPSTYYCGFPPIDVTLASDMAGTDEVVTAPLEKRYGLYIYARQTGTWVSMIFSGNMDTFRTFYTLNAGQDYKDYPPVFLTHSLNDPDVPFLETQALSKLLANNRVFYTFDNKEHDYDKNTDSKETMELIKRSIKFLDEQIC